ncbi:MAG: hypothetical protein AB7R89_04480 [Dehalococcoidia bacterium]
MANETVQVLVLRDGEGNLYLLDRNTIETGRIPEERQSEVAQLLQDDVGGYFFDIAALNNVINVPQTNNATANNIALGVFATGPQTIVQVQGNTANVGANQQANP